MRRQMAWTFAVVLLPALAVAQAPPAAEQPQYDWVRGPKTVNLGSVAQLDLPAGYAFLNAADTRRLQASLGNTSDGKELGLVTSEEKEANWFVVFDYNPVGYVSDEEKDRIDAQALLDGIRKGTEAANAARKSKGIAALHVVGWQKPPYYDQRTHNLSWGILGKDDAGSQVANFNVRLLGRRGYVSATLVDDAAAIGAARPHLDRLLGAFAYKQGNRYAEYRSGDKLAEYGLVALVAGGAGAVAAKTGLLAALFKLLAKGGKALVLLLAAGVAGLKKLLGVFRNDSNAV